MPACFAESLPVSVSQVRFPEIIPTAGRIFLAAQCAEFREQRFSHSNVTRRPEAIEPPSMSGSWDRQEIRHLEASFGGHRVCPYFGG